MTDEEISFEAAYHLTQQLEGGHNPDDEGSDTWYGIRRENHPNEPWPPTVARAKEIAFQQYWKPYNLGKLPGYFAAAAFDWLFNGGPAIRELQRLCGVQQDGRIGSMTAQAVRSHQELMPVYLAARLEWMMALPNWSKNRHVWTNRVLSLAWHIGRVEG